MEPFIWLYLAIALGLVVGGVLVGAVHLSFRAGTWIPSFRKAAGVTACVAGGTVGTADVDGAVGVAGWVEPPQLASSSSSAGPCYVARSRPTPSATAQ